MNKEKIKEKIVIFHDKNYKLLLLISLVLLLSSIAYMFYFYKTNNDFFYKDISLTGGTSVTLNNEINIEELTNSISSKLDSVKIREISDPVTHEQIAVIVETKSDESQTRKILEDYLKYQLDSENSSFEFTGSTLGQDFYKQLLIAICIGFFLMALVVFIQFKSIIPSLSVILSSSLDIFFSLVVLNLLKIPISTAGIVALLMLIGYSVDTNILLTNKVLKRESRLINKNIFESFKTGITMTLTSMFAVLTAFLIVGRFSSSLYQIFLIMLLGLAWDIFNTWITNVSLIKWYVLKKEKKKNEN